MWSPWKTHWALALVKGIREPHKGKKKFFWPRAEIEPTTSGLDLPHSADWATKSDRESLIAMFFSLMLVMVVSELGMIGVVDIDNNDNDVVDVVVDDDSDDDDVDDKCNNSFPYFFINE